MNLVRWWKKNTFLVKIATSAVKRNAHDSATEDSDSDAIDQIAWKEALRLFETKMDARDLELRRRYEQGKMKKQ